MELKLLGPVEVVGDDGPVDLGGTRPMRALLALVTATGRRLTTDELIDRCFDEEGRPDDPAPALWTAIRRLRRALDDGVITTHRGGAGGYALTTDGVVTDVERFEELITAGRATSDPVAGQTHFRQALDLWRGTPFGELGGLDWLMPERIRLEELRLVALEGWHDAHLRNGSATEIIPSLESVAAQHPLRERFHRQLMQALFVVDRQPDALRVFQRFRNEMIGAGLEPSAEAVALEQRIAIGDPSLRASAARSLRGYEIEERLGEGAFSIVYRGRQPSVDRLVAIKQIRAELANRPEFIRRFETEAHLVARLEHPYIVPLYDYWREPGSAYLVMRYLRGGNLESRLFDGRLDLDKTLAMVHQVGDALATAHRAGVVHRDVKPANILLDEDGNAYLADFGIALEASEAADPAAALSAGSPAYASPEQLQRLPVGPSADVHGLAIATYEALTGRLPFPDEPNKAAMVQRQLHDPIPPVRDTRTDVPAALDVVLARATAKSPADRYQSVEEFVIALDAAVGPEADGDAPRRGGQPTGSRRTTIAADERNPYKGLRAFDEADAADFTGRERLVDQLIETLESSRLVAVVGPSGSGKSSVVRAGLLPAVRQGRVRGSAEWFITTLIPGPNPFEELETALLRIASQRPSDLLSVLSDGDRGIARGVRHALPEAESQVLLVIDQFEELFTLAQARQTAAFLDALAVAVSEERSRLRVVLTLRADFYDRPLRHDAVGRLVRDATVAVLPLAPDELEHAIVDPAHTVGAEFEPGLVAEISADVADQPGALPLLQYALTELYELRQSGLLTRDAYRKLGGVAGALARRAEDLYDDASDDERVAIRRVFGRLVSLGEGTEDTRRRALRSELGDETSTSAVIDRYGEARLLSFDRDPGTREPTVEVAHEALLREWPRLSEWLDEDRDGLRILRHLNTTANDWSTAGRPDGELYRGGRLEAAEAFALASPEGLRPIERDFVEASSNRREAEVEAEQRTNRRLRRLLVGVATIATIALAAGVFAFVQRNRSQDNAARAETERIAAEAAAFAGDDVPLSLLLAVEAHSRDAGPSGLGALQTALSRAGSFLQLVPHEGADAVHWIDADTLVTTGDAGADLVTWRTGEVARLFETPIFQRLHVVGDGNTRLVTMADAFGGTIAFARADDPSLVELRNLDGSSRAQIRATSNVDAIEIAADGTVMILDFDGWLIAAEPDGTERWRVHAHPEQEPDEFATLSPADKQYWHYFGLEVTGKEFSQLTPYNPQRRPQVMRTTSDAETVFTTEAWVLRSFSIQDGAMRTEVLNEATLSGHDLPTLLAADDLALAANADNYTMVLRHLLATDSVSNSADGSLAGVETSIAGQGSAKPTKIVQADQNRSLLLMADGRLIWVDNTDGHITSVVGTTLSAPTDATLSPDGSLVAVASPDGVVLFSVTGGGALATGVPRDGMSFADILEDGTVTTGSAKWQFEGWRLGNWWDISGSSPVRRDAPFDEETPELATGFGNGSIVGGYTTAFEASIRDAETLELLTVFKMPGSWTGQDLRDDLGIGAFGTLPGVNVYDLSNPEPLVTLEEPGAYAASMVFNQDGSILTVSGLDGHLYMYRTNDWSMLDIDALQGDENVRAVSYHPDGARLVTLEATGDLVVRDADTVEIQSRLAGAGLPLVADSEAFLYDESGRYLLTSGDASAILWDLEAEALVGVPFPNNPDFRIGGRDGPELVTAVGEWLKVWNLDIEAWPALACQVAGRNLTGAEWEQFGPAGEPYRATCPQWPWAEDR